MISEYDQIRKGLEKIRSLKEEITRDNEVIDLNQTNNDPEVTSDGKVGEKIAFDDINTVGFLNSQKSLSDEVKNEITNTVGVFIKSTGLLLDTITINVEDSRIILNSETIKNPGIDSIKSITFDTNNRSPPREKIYNAYLSMPYNTG